MRPALSGAATRTVVVALAAGVLVGGCSALPTVSAALPTGASSSGASRPIDLAPTAATGLPSSAPSTVQLRTAVESVLSRRAAAIRDGDAVTWTATGADPTTFAAVQRLAVRDLALVRVRSAVEAVSSAPGAPRWVVGVDLRYGLADLPTWSGRVSADWVIGPDGQGGRGAPTWRVVEESWRGPAPVWMLPGLRVERSLGVVVAGNVPAGEVARVAARAATARSAMSSVWRGVPDLLVVAPATVEDLATLLPGARPGNGTAAVTTGRSPGGGSDTIHLVPGVGLSDVGLQATLTHEAVHVVVREQHGNNAPLWLVEGFAQEIGYADLDLPARRIAAEGLADIAAHGLPQTLPTDQEFDAHPGVAYPLAWRAVDVLTRRAGRAVVRDLVGRCADDPAGPSTCSVHVARVWGAPLTSFIDAWRADLAQLGTHRG